MKIIIFKIFLIGFTIFLIGFTIFGFITFLNKTEKFGKFQGCHNALKFIYKERLPDSVFFKTWEMCSNYEK